MLKPFWLHLGKGMCGLNSLRMGSGTYVSRDGWLTFRAYGMRQAQYACLAIAFATRNESLAFVDGVQ
jgi:hypothetical protein